MRDRKEMAMIVALVVVTVVFVGLTVAMIAGY